MGVVRFSVEVPTSPHLSSPWGLGRRGHAAALPNAIALPIGHLSLDTQLDGSLFVPINGRAHRRLLPGRHPPLFHLHRARLYAAHGRSGNARRSSRPPRCSAPPPDEANLAALYVAPSAQALDRLRLARLYPNNPAVVLKCTARSGRKQVETQNTQITQMRANGPVRYGAASPIVEYGNPLTQPN